MIYTDEQQSLIQQHLPHLLRLAEAHVQRMRGNNLRGGKTEAALRDLCPLLGEDADVPLVYPGRGPAWPGSALPGKARLGSAWQGWAVLGQAGLGGAGNGEARLGRAE